MYSEDEPENASTKSSKQRIVIDLFTRFGTTPGVTERRVDGRTDGRGWNC